MYSKKLVSKTLFGVVLASALTLSSMSPILGTNNLIRAEAVEAVETKDILKEAYVKTNDLGFGIFLSIVLEDGVEYEKCRFEVDGEKITPTKVSDTGSVLKWEIFSLQNKALTVHYEGKTQTVIFNENGKGVKPYNIAGVVKPKWIWTSGTANIFDFHSSAYDENGRRREVPEKTTFDVLNSTGEEKEEVSYFVDEAILINPEAGGPEVTIKFSLLTEKAMSWFHSVSYVARMATTAQSKGLDEMLAFEKEVSDYRGTKVGVLKLRRGQMPLRRSGMNYIRVISGEKAVVIPVEIVEDKAPTLSITGAITNPKVGEDFKFKVSGINQGLLSQNEFIRKAVLRRPVSDGSQEFESIDLKFGEIGLIGDLLVIDKKMTTKAGVYELEIGFKGYRTIKQKFEILPSKGKTPEVGNKNGSQNGGNAGGGSAGGGAISGGGSTGDGVISGDGSVSVDGATGATPRVNLKEKKSGGADTKKSSELTLKDEKTPLSDSVFSSLEAELEKVKGREGKRKALAKDMKGELRKGKELRLKDLLIFLYKRDNKKDGRASEMLFQGKLDKKVLRHVMRLKLVSKKSLTGKGLTRVLSKKEIEKIMKKYLKAAFPKKERKKIKVHAMAGATKGRSLNIGKGRKGGSGDANGQNHGTIATQAEFLFDYDMLVNAILLNELGIGNIYSDRIAKMFMEEATAHRAIFHQNAKLYDFDKYRTYFSDQKLSGVYVDYNRYTHIAREDDLVKGSAYQLTIVLDTGALGKHYYGGLSGNPKEFGGKLPELGRISVKRGEDLVVDLKDSVYAEKIWSHNGFAVNTTQIIQTKDYGIRREGTRLRMPKEKVLEAIGNSSSDASGKNSFYIMVSAKGYERLRIDVDVYAK